MEFNDVIASRHSVRHFLDKEVPHRLLDAMVLQAGTAPSSRHSKSSAFMIVEDPDTLHGMRTEVTVATPSLPFPS